MKSTNENTGRPDARGAGVAIIKAGLLAGSLDILVALAYYYFRTGKNPLLVLKFIASAVYGKEAFGEGNYMVAVGFVFHFITAFGWTIFFFIIYPWIPALSKNNIITGLLYGVFIWLVMNLLLLPVTNVPKSPFNMVQSMIGALILVLAVGLPVSIIANKYYSKGGYPQPE